MVNPVGLEQMKSGAHPPLLAMRAIRKGFAAGEVLHGVDFTLAHGQIHALVGHNGAGKSTLMKVLGGVYPDYTGNILIEGSPVHPRTPREALEHGIAVIYQDFALVPDLTVAENIALGREPRGPLPGTVDHRGLRERSIREAKALGIELPLDATLRQLGVAEQQLTEIVKALARDARILVMDEPTARLSPGERDRLFDIMRSLSARRVGVVYISHFLEEVFSIADRVTVLRDGEVVAARPSTDFDLHSLTTLMIGERSRAGRPARQRVAELRPTVLELGGFTPTGGSPVSFSLGAGEILGVAGLVGAGRTHLAKALVGGIQSTGGLRLDGRSVHFRSPRDGVRAGVVLLPEDRKRQGLVLTGTVGDNLSLAALGQSLSELGFVRGGALRELVDGLIDRFRVLPADPARGVRTLSGGNQQKTLVGRAFGARAKVLILDQPTAGVDVGAKAELHDHIASLSREGVAIIVISDDLDELLSLSDRILVMRGGRPVEICPAGDFTRPTLLEAITREPGERTA